MFVCKSSVVRQYLIVIVANFSYFPFGLETGWPSPVLAKLKDANQTVLPQPISDHDAAWVASIGLLVGLPGMLISSYLIDRFGRKGCLVISYIPRLVKTLLCVFASEAWMLILARSLSGISDLFAICLVCTYTSEIASKEIRGALGTISQMFFAAGMMVVLCVGPFLSYLALNIMSSVITFAFFVPLIFLPETPYFLYSKGLKEESIKTLTFLRGSKEAAYEEIMDYSTSSDVAIDKIKLIKDVNFWKSLGKGMFLGVGAQATGYNSLSFYLQTIFASTHTTVKPEVSSLVIGCIELLGCTCNIFITDRLGRKPILTVSLSFMATGMIGLGTFFYFKNHNYEITGFLNYLPLLSITLTIFCYNAGIGSILMMFIAEIFDGPSRATGVSIVVFVTCFFTFLVIRYLAAVTAAVGPMSTYYGFSVGCLILCFFIIFCLPETKGKAFSQIQNEMKNCKKKDGEAENDHWTSGI